MLFQKNEKSYYRKKRTLQLDGKLISLEQPLVMGILNVTPDSFYDGGCYTTEKEIVTRSEFILSEGGTIIDIGAQSTRPGAKVVSSEEEIERLLPAVKAIRNHFPQALLSVDSYRSEVIERVFAETGPIIVNDISGGSMDEKMFETVAHYGLPYILMHIQGTPRTMQNNPSYDDIVKEVLLYFSERVNLLNQMGVKDVILDPGFGFGKTLDHNFSLLNSLDAFRIFELPLMVGISRKSMIWRYLEISPEESLNGSTVLNVLALTGGADLLRVHDVREAVEAVRIVSKLKMMNT